MESTQRGIPSHRLSKTLRRLSLPLSQSSPKVSSMTLSARLIPQLSTPRKGWITAHPARMVPSKRMVKALTVALIMVTLAMGRAPGVEVHLLNGRQFSDDQPQITSKGLTLPSSEGISFAWQDVDRLIVSTPEEDDNASEDDRYILLKDGSWLPVRDIEGRENGIEAQTTIGNMQLPLGSAVAWGSADWIRRNQDRSGDIVAINGSEIEGTIQGIRDQQIILRTELSPEPLMLPLSDVIGVYIAIPVDRPRGVYLAAHLDPQVPPLLLVATDDHLVLQAQPKQTVNIKQLAEIVVHGGRRVFLSHMTPSRVVEEGAFGVVWNYQKDRNLDGSPLILDGQLYTSGLVIHSKAELEWELNQKYSQFSAKIGISDLLGQQGDCAVTIYGDDDVLWQNQSIRGGTSAISVSLDVSTVTTMRILVDYGARYDIGDHLALAGAWLLAKPE